MPIGRFNILVAFAFGAAWFSEQFRRLTVSVTCDCGRQRADLTLVEPRDAQRYAQLLREDCPNCRAASRILPDVSPSTFDLRPSAFDVSTEFGSLPEIDVVA